MPLQESEPDDDDGEAGDRQRRYGFGKEDRARQRRDHGNDVRDEGDLEGTQPVEQRKVEDVRDRRGQHAEEKQRGDRRQRGRREPLWLAEGWREYSFEWTTPELSTDTLHFAVGTAVLWEADATHYVDDLSVTIEPR